MACYLYSRDSRVHMFTGIFFKGVKHSQLVHTKKISIEVNPKSMSFHIVLVEPEIPANTGNIARTCAATGAHLHLIKPLGFQIDDKAMKRAGLDYWDAVQLHVHDSIDELLASHPQHRFFFATTKAHRTYSDYVFQNDDFFVFGKETKGLPADLLAAFPDQLMRLPMSNAVRSLNLSNSVAIILYEGFRQIQFEGLQ